MTWIYLTIPLMLLAIGIATVPVLYFSIREHRRLHGPAAPRPTSKPMRSDYWTRPVSHHDIRTRRAVRASQSGRATATLEAHDPATGEDRDETERQRRPEPTLV
ncbi:MAG TPA: hypothetical protein VHU85_05500 [Acidimicrobiales bacterium]|nr:hypothetical protein [Acidimicrobiales bacterium]